MKKSTVFVLCLIMVLSSVFLPACGADKTTDLSGSKYVGTWKGVSMTLKDEKGEFEDEINLILNADGTAKFTSGDEVTEYTWKETSNGFKLEGGAKMTFTDDGDGIKSKVLGVELHFERQQ